MILLISEDGIEDMSKDLYNKISDMGYEVRLVKQGTIPCENKITLFPKNGQFRGSLYIDSEEIDISTVSAIYPRIGTCNYDGENISENTKLQLDAERQILLLSLLEHIDAMVINRAKSQFYNSSKLFQSWIIKNYGFKIPNSIISNDENEIRNFINQYKNNGVIYKSASAERSRVVKFKKEDMDKLNLVKNCPHLFQECVQGVDIRVHTLATGETFACQVKTKTSDYRYDKERSIVPCDIPDEVKKACVQMTLDMGLYLSGIDLRKTYNGDYYCFEVNPSPAFSWYEYQTGLPIADAVAKMMINANKYKKLAVRKY